MRIDNVKIKNYKNLKEFSIDLNGDEMKTVLLGQNATGKSNFIEVLVLIFKYLDLSTESKRLSPGFDYEIIYRIKGNLISVICKDNNYIVLVNGEKPTFKHFFSQEGKAAYQPKYVFTYYSGLSNKLKEHFWDHQKKFYDKIISDDFKENDLDTLRKLFYVQLVHSYFVLLAYFTHEEKESIDFLKEVLQIEDIESILFVLKMPTWAKNRIKDNPKDIFWTAKGLVRPFLEKLWDLALAPIYSHKDVRIDFDDYDPQEQLYLFLKGKDKLKELANTYTSNTALFKALESTYISKLISEVRIKVRKKNVDGSITFKELSEGEQQLLTVLGLLKFTKDEDSLILLDEPDTHLNPLWKWRYLEFLDKVVDRPNSTQIILNTHDPLVIGSLKKEEVRIFNLTSNGLEVEEPQVDPRSMDIITILRSELFNLPSVLSKYMQLKLNRKRYLLFRIENKKASKEEIEEYDKIQNEISQSGFNDASYDPWYNRYLDALSENPLFQKVEFTVDEQAELKKLSDNIIEKLTRERFPNEGN